MREHYEYQDLAKYYKGDHGLKCNWDGIPEGLDVLNVGCGKGELTHAKGWVGLDFNLNLLEIWHDDMEGIICDAEDIPWVDAAFTWTVSSDFLEHVQDPDEVIRELKRVGVHGRHYISTAPQSGFRGPGGENLHVSAGFDFTPYGQTTRKGRLLLLEW